MAIVGSLVAYWTYRGLAGRATLDAPRRVVAAGAAGYLAINVSALLAALQFGIQPALFQDATGAPLYAPYPLSVAVPAMALGHLTFAGLAEMFIAGGLVAYLQRAHPEFLQRSAPGAGSAAALQQLAPAAGDWRTTRSLWFGLAVLMLLSPLGLLAAGIAWGEWGPSDFQDPAVHQQIVAASGNVPPPETVPSGLKRLSSIWTAPIPDYAPTFMRSESFGYILSAMVGTGLILLVFLLISRIVVRAGTSASGRA
jgi:cobalt/nickel transport system permease protein